MYEKVSTALELRELIRITGMLYIFVHVSPMISIQKCIETVIVKCARTSYYYYLPHPRMMYSLSEDDSENTARVMSACRYTPSTSNQ